MKQILFFGLKEDLLPVLEAFESNRPLKYVLMGQFSKDRIDVLKCGGELPNLGRATAGSSIACESYLICTDNTPVNLRALHVNGNTDRFFIDQLVNPDTVTFTSGGSWNDEIVLHGRVATVSESPASQNLMKGFHSAIRKSFTKIKAFYVGPKALEMMERGARLTISAQSPREFDLTAPSSPSQRP